MIAAILAMMMMAADPAPAVPAPAVPAPAVIVAAPPAASEPEKTSVQTARDNLDQAQQIYTQSCGDRAYGAYDDLCEQLSVQIRQYRINLDKLEREAAKSASARPRS